MALTSVAGATLMKLQTGGAGYPVPVSFTSQSYCGWIKIPNLNARVWFNHDNKLEIGNDGTGKIYLKLDNSITLTGITVLPTNKWVFWGYKRTAPDLHTVRVNWLECVDNVPTYAGSLIEINVNQSFAAGDPTSFTLHVPAGCSICGFRYGNSSTNLTQSSFDWGTTSGNVYIWRTPLRFPNDLYDHREISASQGDISFNGMHNWTTVTGSIILDATDPESLLDKVCSAVLGVVTGLTLDTTHADIPPSTEVTNNTVPLPITINTDVLPATAVVSSVSVGGRADLIDPGGDPAKPLLFPDTWGFYRRTPDPTVYGPYTFAGDQYPYYDWSHFGVPNFANAPAGVNPSTGLPWTLADYYASIYYAGCKWGPTSDPDGGRCSTHRTYDAGIEVLYFGQTTPGTCGAGPPPSLGTIIVNKIVSPDNGETFPFDTVNLTPNAFSLGNGDSITYNNVPAGSGYGINEIVPAGWNVSYSVSNGSPHDNISLIGGETVVVTVTDIKLPNTSSGIYKIVKDKRQDTLWVTFDPEATRDVKIPNPTYRTGLVGE